MYMHGFKRHCTHTYEHSNTNWRLQQQHTHTGETERRVKTTHELLLLLNVNYVQGVFKHRKYTCDDVFSSIFLFLLLLFFASYSLCALSSASSCILFSTCSLSLDIGNGLILEWRVHSLKPVNFIGVLLMLELVEVNAFKQKWILFAYIYSNAKRKDLLFVLPPLPPPPPPNPTIEWRRKKMWWKSYLSRFANSCSTFCAISSFPVAVVLVVVKTFFAFSFALSLAASIDFLLLHLFNFQ